MTAAWPCRVWGIRSSRPLARRELLDSALDLSSHREISLGHSLLAVCHQGEGHLIPSKDEDIGMVICSLGEVRDGIHQGDRRLKVLALHTLADTVRRELPSGEVPEASADLVL